MSDDQLPAPAPPDSIAKPAELVALAHTTTELFTTLKTWFAVPDTVAMPLDDIAGDHIAEDLRSPQLVAAHAMRKLQALHCCASPGLATKPDVPLNLIDSVLRSLAEAPSWHLSHQVGSIDWDQEHELLEAGLIWKPPPAADAVPAFHALVRQLIEARACLVDLCKAGNPEMR